MKCPVCGEEMRNAVAHVKKHITGKKGGKKESRKK